MTLNIFGREIEIKKSVLILAIISITIIAGGIGYMITHSGKDIIIEGKSMQTTADTKKNTAGQTGSNLEPTAAAGTGETTDNKKTDIQQVNDTIKIYIVGCVKKPGVITLKKGQLIDDAVKAAGGLTADADPSSINMVYELKENVMLYIQSRKEMNKSSAVQSSSGSTGASNGATATGKGVTILKGSGSAIVSGSSIEAGSSSGVKNGKVNINTASAAELDTLPGVGEATAKEIINFREKNGPFKAIKDIMKIPRIKDSRFNAIKDYITVS